MDFISILYIHTNAQVYQPDNSRSTLEFPENAADIAPSRHAGRAERNGHGGGSSVRIVERASTLSSYDMGAAYQGSNSPEPAADTRILGRLVLSEGAKSSVEQPLGSFSRGWSAGTGTFER